MKRLAVLLFLAATAHAQMVTTQFTTRLTDSGDDPPIMPVVSDATEPTEPLTPALHVSVPNAQAPRILTLISPAIAIPYNSRIRQIQAFWNATPLPLIDPRRTQLTEEAHSFGPMIPFFKPLFSIAAIPAGDGTLEIRAFDGGGTQIASQSISGLTIVKPPAPIPTSTIAAMPHPRIYLPSRIAATRSRSDVASQRFGAPVTAFRSALAEFPDVTSPQFEARIYDPEDYIPLLGLQNQLAPATNLAQAADTRAMRIAHDSAPRRRRLGRGVELRAVQRGGALARQHASQGHRRGLECGLRLVAGLAVESLLHDLARFQSDVFIRRLLGQLSGQDLSFDARGVVVHQRGRRIFVRIDECESEQ